MSRQLCSVKHFSSSLQEVTSTLKMYKLIALVLVSVAVVTAFDIIEDDEGQQFYLVPVHRQKRQTSVDIAKGNPGTRVTLGHKGNIFNNGVHRLDGAGSVSKNFRPSGPTTVGGGLGYSHIPSGSNLNVGAQHTKRYGTDFSASGTANLWQKGNSRLDAVGRYDRHFGGIGGTGRPNYYGGLNFNHRF